MSDKMREALRAAYLAGSQYGHNATVEGFWADDPDIASDYVDEALAGHLAQPDGQCSYCRTYNGHQDGCIYAPPALAEQPAQGDTVPTSWRPVAEVIAAGEQHGTHWLALRGGRVTFGEYEWCQGWHPDSWNTPLGRLGRGTVSHCTPFHEPEHPLAAAPEVKP